MMDDDGLPEALPPVCATCGRTLARVDHYAIEHFILKGMVYRDLG